MPLPKGSNPNHPRKGAIIKVEPIRDLKAIKRIKAVLKESNIVHHCLFVVGINTAFRASDLAILTPGHINGDEITLRERKTGKVRTVKLNEYTLEVIREAQRVLDLKDDDYLFQGQRGRLSIPYISSLVKSWCSDAGLVGNYGSHTLRKTFGYHQRVTFGVELPLLMNVYGHSSQRQTLTYLCIDEQEITDVYLNVL